MEVLVKMVHFSRYLRLKAYLIQVPFYSFILEYKIIFKCSYLHFFPFLTLGPGFSASKICMDKVATSLAVKHVR